MELDRRNHTLQKLTFNGATTTNQIKIPDNLANALAIQEGSNIYQQFVTTNGSEAVYFAKHVGIGTNAPGSDHLSVLNDSDLSILFKATGTDKNVGFTLDGTNDQYIKFNNNTSTVFTMGTNEGYGNFFVIDHGSINGSDFIIDSSGKVGKGTISPDRQDHTEVADAATNTVVYAQRLSHVSSATVVAGFGTGIEFELEENDGTNRVAGIVECLWTDAGAVTNADADFVFKLMLNDGAAAEKARITSAGNITAQGDFYQGANQGLSGTLTVDDGANWNLALVFSGGILTSQTIGASSGAACTWT